MGGGAADPGFERLGSPEAGGDARKDQSDVDRAERGWLVTECGGELFAVVDESTHEGEEAAGVAGLWVGGCLGGGHERITNTGPRSVSRKLFLLISLTPATRDSFGFRKSQDARLHRTLLPDCRSGPRRYVPIAARRSDATRPARRAVTAIPTVGRRKTALFVIHPLIAPMDLPRTTPPVWDRCIYCGLPPEQGRRLGDEHIIAVALGGVWELQRASCRGCERITSTVEKEVAGHLVTPVREHLGLLGRQQNKPRRRMPVTILRDGKRIRQVVATNDHPGAMMTWRYGLPTALTGEPLESGIGGRVMIRPLHTDFSRRAAAIEGQINLIDRGPVSLVSLARVLAKTAHAYAMAKLGPTGFRPLLREVILGEQPNYPARFVGGTNTLRDRPSKERHNLAIDWVSRIDGGLFLVVTVRLFGDLNLPTYQVITGEAISHSSPYRPTDAHPIARLQLSGICLADGRLGQTSLVPLSDRGVLISSEDAPRVDQSLFAPHRIAHPRED